MSEAILDKLDKHVNTLYLELCKDWNISFQEWDKDYCEVFRKDKNATIYYNIHEFSNETIAHELLHIQQKKYGYMSSNHFWFYFQEHEFFKDVFTKYLCDFIGNYMEHNKMFLTYLEMGYAPEKFVQSGGDLLADLDVLSRINLEKNGTLLAYMTETYIGNLLAILADPIEKNYAKHLQTLQEADPELYEIGVNFWGKWVNFEVEKRDVFSNNEMDIYDQFTDDLEDWYDTKTTKL